MDNSGKFSDVNFDDDGDNEHSAFGEESEIMESTDRNVSDDSIENSDSIVIDGRFVRINSMTVDDIEGLHFGSENDAYKFYVKYARSTGFVVRKHNVTRNCSGTIVTRQFVCNKHGERNPIHLTRADRVDRCGAYSAACNRLCKVAAESGACFNDVMDDILKLTEKYSNLKLRGSARTQNSEVDRHIGDPDAVNSKGAPPKRKSCPMKRPKHCTNCNDTKHNAKTCRMRIDVNGSQMENDKDAAKFSKATYNSDKEISKSDLNNIHGSVRSKEGGRQIDKNVKEKSNSNPKQKKAKDMNETNHHIGGLPMMSQVQPNANSSQDKEMSRSDLNNIHGSNLKEKSDSDPKQEKAKDGNETNHPIGGLSMMSQVQPNAHEMHYPTPHFANSSQVPPPTFATTGQTPTIGSLPMMSVMQPNAQQMYYPMSYFANSSQVPPPIYAMNGQTPPSGGLPMMSQLQPNTHQMQRQVPASTFAIDGQTPPILQQPPQVCIYNIAIVMI
ncbi:hypothetical protein TSUD_220440 [Trifolium subterraneum]|uniref:FAR1 domain-containing protein n=1 Tax=Trifolium subterraneum TaxID=3900 RepID=A0A2Z6MYG7_TRISU|nr:hypothetical protein TSUD_220440 [Trifolium subterraneum]